jgi:DNA polymerase-1
MTNPFANVIAKVAGSSPMAQGSVPVTPGRTLLVDGDGLAYYCAGNDDTSAGEARERLVDKVRSAQKQVGAESVKILLTASGSHKGHRYAIARVKPYQAQRAGSRRPVNWQALRDFMFSNELPFNAEATAVAEADDLFGYHAYRNPGHTVIYTQDKDMRMLPGMHLDWVNHRVHTVEWQQQMDGWVTAHSSEFNDKQYGPRWFWLQMLQGDTADNIPGLPKYLARDVFKPVGEVTADKLLTTPMIGEGYANTVAAYYKSYYGERWLVEMIEQACLLWMRRCPEDWDDCINPGGPMHRFGLDGGPVFAMAYSEIESRVRQADDINNAAQGERGSDSARETGNEAGEQVRSVPTPPDQAGT